MNETQLKVAAPLRSAQELVAHVADTGMGTLDSREWQEDWKDRWVAFADLIAFASRAMRSDTVVLNNIVRFDRAAQIVGTTYPAVRVRRFSDATFAIASDFHDVLGYAVSLSHACLALNREYLDRAKKHFFIHLIVPRITIARGSVLLLPDAPPDEPRFAGINSTNVLAGAAVVRAYQMEKYSAGGLITVGGDALSHLQSIDARGKDGRVRRGLRRWISRLNSANHRKTGEIHCFRGKMIDIPWLLLRPVQNESGRIWAADPEDANYALIGYLDTWRTSIREFYAPQNCDAPLEVAKHYSAAIRHAIHCYQLSHGRSKPGYQTADEVRELLML